MANWRDEYELHEGGLSRRKVVDLSDLDEPETDEDE
jgi:hypothetical protein